MYIVLDELLPVRALVIQRSLGSTVNTAFEFSAAGGAGSGGCPSALKRARRIRLKFEFFGSFVVTLADFATSPE